MSCSPSRTHLNYLGHGGWIWRRFYQANQPNHDSISGRIRPNIAVIVRLILGSISQGTDRIIQVLPCTTRHEDNIAEPCLIGQIVYECFLLQCRHKERDGVSNHRRLHCLLNRLFRPKSKKPLKPRDTGPLFPAQRASNMENVSLWWRFHGLLSFSSQVYIGGRCRYIHCR